VACHNTKLKSAGLDLSTAAGFARGADGGPLVDKADPEKSRLLDVISYHSATKMPPTGRLKDQQIAEIAAWVKAGAPWPDAAPAPAQQAETGKRQFTPEQKSFWAFQPVKDHAVPAVRDASWPRSPIDNFVLTKLEQKGLTPAQPADKLTLIRRATFDLTGLPPTAAEIEAFLQDQSPDAFAKVVDRLLASPRYGERWGRHWLDVARYADSTGADEDIRYPYAFKYRDYVIDAFNRDLPYDQFVKEQIAGDLLPAKPGEVNTRGIIATGFLAIGLKLLAEQDKPKMVYDMVDEQLDATSRAFMGLTVTCARCHDHKFDPIPTKDYYSMAGIFASTKSLAKVEGTVSQIYFAPLVSGPEFARYEEQQKNLEFRKKQILDITARESTRYRDGLMPRLAEYMLAADAYQRRPVAEEGLCVADFARRKNLNPAVLERWIDYLQPSDDIRPHLDRWFKARKEGPAALAETAAAYQKQFEATAAEWKRKLDAWHAKVSEAVSRGTTPPDEPMFEGGKDRFFESVAMLAGGPFHIPEAFPRGMFFLRPDGDPESWLNSLYSDESNRRIRALEGEMADLRKNGPPEPPMASAVTEGPSVEQRVFIRGNVSSPGEPAPKRFLTILAGEDQTPITKGSGRLELAEWLASPKHPLTARVMVNRIWQFHFGEGLVRTPNNFGKLGEAPTHPELLDYLATRFVESGWSVKKMHRLVMLSSAYQMSSRITKEQSEADPGNRLLSHFSRRRLDVEEIRDGLLAVDRSLDLTMGGTLQLAFGTDVENSAERLSIDPSTSRRRTVYLPLRRSNLPTLLNLFDFGDATTPGEGRANTNVAPQALFMLNSKFIYDRSRELASHLLAEANADDQRRIEEAFVDVFGRRPSGEETAKLLAYVQNFQRKAADSRQRFAEPKLAAWQSLCRVLISSNEFIYVD
jgi:cytochrome c553